MENQKHWILKTDFASKLTGTASPQLVPLNWDYNISYQFPKNYKNIYDPFPEGTSFDFQLDRGAKLTDLPTHYQILGSGKLMSKPFYEFISQFRMIPHQLIPVQIHHKGEQIDEFVYVNNTWHEWGEYIYWDKMEWRNMSQDPYHFFKIQSFDDYKSLTTKYKINPIRIASRILSKCLPFDYYCNPCSASDILVSSILHKVIQKQFFSAIEIKPYIESHLISTCL